MKRTLMTLTIVLALSVTMTFAQGWGRGKGRNCRQPVHTFDTANPVTLEGKIVKVEKVESRKGRNSTGVHLTVASKGKDVPVSVGPSFYLDAQKMTLKKGDSVKIKAFKGTGTSDGRFFAAGITNLSGSGKGLVLRDASGLPEWRRNKDGNNRGRGRGYGRQANARAGNCRMR